MLYVSQRKWSSSFIVVASWFGEFLLEPSTVLASVWTDCPSALLHGCHPDSSSSISLSVVSDSLWPRGLYPARFLCQWDSLDKNTGVGCHCLLQGIFLTQVLNRSLLHCRQTLSWLSHQGSLLCRYLTLKLSVPSASLEFIFLGPMASVFLISSTFWRHTPFTYFLRKSLKTCLFEKYHTSFFTWSLVRLDRDISPKHFTSEFHHYPVAPRVAA